MKFLDNIVDTFNRFARPKKDTRPAANGAPEPWVPQLRKADTGRSVALSNVHAARINAQARQALADCDVVYATAEEYADWAEGYLKQGGKFLISDRTNVRDDEVFVARHGAVIPPLFGAAMISIIVPQEIRVSVAPGNSHNHIMWMNNFTASRRDPWMYKDAMRIVMQRGYTKSQIENGINPQQKPAAPSVTGAAPQTAAHVEINKAALVGLRGKATVKPFRLKGGIA